MAEQWTLQDIEESLQERITFLSKNDLGDVPYSDYTDCYTALAQVKQAVMLAEIALQLAKQNEHLQSIRESVAALAANS